MAESSILLPLTMDAEGAAEIRLFCVGLTVSPSPLALLYTTRITRAFSQRTDEISFAAFRVTLPKTFLSFYSSRSGSKRQPHRDTTYCEINPLPSAARLRNLKKSYDATNSVCAVSTDRCRWTGARSAAEYASLRMELSAFRHARSSIISIHCSMGEAIEDALPLRGHPRS